MLKLMLKLMLLVWLFSPRMSDFALSQQSSSRSDGSAGDGSAAGSGGIRGPEPEECFCRTGSGCALLTVGTSPGS